MRDPDCVRFLQWCLPRLDLRWAGYRKVRRTLCKRIGRRLRELGLDDIAAYQSHLDKTPDEWARLDAFCRIPISRFYRDRGAFDHLARHLLPELARRASEHGGDALYAWSAGCASGEEVYTLRLIWDLAVQPSHPAVQLNLLGTDVDANMLRRAEAALYQGGSLKELPPAWRAAAFVRDGDLYALGQEFRHDIAFEQQDIRHAWPDGPFHLILCRNLAFTYFAPGLQDRILAAIAARLAPGGSLMIGGHERLPEGTQGLSPVAPHLPIYHKAGLLD